MDQEPELLAAAGGFGGGPQSAGTGVQRSAMLAAMDAAQREAAAAVLAEYDDAEAAGAAPAPTPAPAAASPGGIGDAMAALFGARAGEAGAAAAAARVPAADNADAFARALAASPWLQPLAQPELFARYAAAGAGEAAFVPVAMLAQRLFVALWRGALAERQRSGRSGAAAAHAGAFALDDVPAEAARELGRVPGLLPALRAAAAAGAPPLLGRAAWQRALQRALPPAHRGALLLLLCERLRLPVDDLVIALSDYAAPAALLDTDSFTGAQEKLFVALAAIVWRVTDARAEAAIARALADADAGGGGGGGGGGDGGLLDGVDAAVAPGMRRGGFSVLQLITRAAPVWAVLGAYSDFAMPPPPLADAASAGAGAGAGAGAADAGGDDGGAAAAAVAASAADSGDITFARWHAFFAARTAADSPAELLHLLVALRRIMRVRGALLRAPAPLTPLFEARAEAEAAAAGGGLRPVPSAAAATLAGVIDGSAECALA